MRLLLIFLPFVTVAQSLPTVNMEQGCAQHLVELYKSQESKDLELLNAEIHRAIEYGNLDGKHKQVARKKWARKQKRISTKQKKSPK